MIGDMKQVVLEQWTQTKSTTGILEDALPMRYKLWAEVKRLNSDKGYDRQIDMKASYSFKVWFNKDYDPNGLSKIVYDGVRYTIHSIEKINEKRFNRLIKTEGNVG